MSRNMFWITHRPALVTASTTEVWYDMNGMSPMMKVFGAPRRTALDIISISSIVTGTVES